MRTNRRGLLATWVAAALLASMGWTTAQAPAASAEPVTPDLPTMNITLPDGVDQGDLDASKDTWEGTKIALEDGSGETVLTEAGEIKGRGNYTWTLAKKPYQIKLDTAQPLLGMGSAKTWILLANHADASLMRNKVAYDFAEALGLPGSPDSRWVDLRINGQYRGNYLISEKVEVKTNRVELAHPEGILAELDHRGEAEDFYHYTPTSTSLFTLKDAKSGVPDPGDGESMDDPDFADTKAGWEDMKDTLDELDRLLYQSTPNWAAISDIIDVDSFVKYYFVFELAENPEITQSSVYFYKDGPDSKLFAGPVWDFDSALANYDKSEPYGADYKSEYVKNAQWLRNKGNGWQIQLFRNTPFVERANALWKSEIAYESSLLPSKIDEYYETVKNSADNNFDKWSVLGKPTLLVAGEGKTYATTYAGEVSYLKTWVSNRSRILSQMYGDVPIVRARGHVQSIGWQPYVNSGQFIGTTGKALRLEGMNLSLLNSPVSGSIQANAHVQKLGWSGYKTLGPTTLIGTTGKALRLEAVQFRLTGDLAAKYVVSYRAHVQGLGWLPWKSNGATAGTTGQARRVEAVQVRLAQKAPPVPTAGP